MIFYLIVIINDDSIKMNFYDKTFIKGILEQINPKFYITNKILPKKDYFTSINRNRYNTNRYNPYENPFNTKVVPFFNNAFDSCCSQIEMLGLEYLTFLFLLFPLQEQKVMVILLYC